MTQSEKDKQILDLVRKLSAAKCNLRHHQIKLDEDVTVLLGIMHFTNSPDQCPAGYSTHTADNLPTQCVFISYDPPYDSDIQEATTGVELSRRGLLWAGVGAMVGGVVLALIPGGQAVSRAVDVQMSPGRVTVGRTFGF